MAGVGAGTGALGSVIGKLATLLGDEYTMLKRVRKDIAFLERELRRMQILVNTLADMEQLDELANDWKGSMRDLSYDMEECIDRFMLRLGDSDAKPKFVKRAVRGFKALFARHGIATQIKELKARVQEEGERRKRLNLDNYAPTATVAIDPRLAAFHGVARDLVAIDGPRDQVISWLTQGGLELKVVAIVGCGGLGKTTLAMEAYRKAGEQFHCRASVSVSRTFDPEKLLKDLLSQIDEAAWSKCKSEMREWDKDQLIREIQRILTGKRYFFVIDDVWKEQHWAFFKAVFRDSCNGSRLIVTTRITKVGRSCCSNSHDQLYQMPHLTAVDSRRLLLKRIFHSDHSCPTQLKDVSDRIIRKCGGLPLAIITIASLLANKSENTVEWERLEDSIGNGLSYESDDDGNGMRHILLLSYWDLPHHLKTCLLYLCIYPEDWHIPCEELKWKWIAEGFIATKRGNLYQEADNCFNELVNRSMIQFVDVTDNFDDFKGYCQIHDMVLDLIISLSDTENFATILNGVCNYLPSKIRRLSLQSSGLEQKGAMHAITRSKLHVRSLNVFGETMEIPPLVDFRSLRVFDMTRGCSSWENNHIRNIGSLYQLRYLEIHKPSITELPEDIGNLQNLETLDLRGTSVEKLPPTIAQLTKLVRLFVDRDCVFSGDMFGSMRALEEVSNITKVDNPEKFLEGLGHLTKLRKLSMCYLWHKDFDRYGGRLRSIVNELGKYNLRYLYTTEELGRLLFSDPCCTFPHLQHLKLQGMMSSLHYSCGLASLTNIIKLQIRVDTLYEEELIILMNMPSLAYLHLGLVMSPSPVTVSSNGFRLLEVFHYSIKRNQGTGIKFAEGAMPALRRLRLSWRADSVLLEESDSADMGIEHLSSLAHLLVETDCEGATVDKVEALEDSILKAVALHPNRHTFQLGFYRYKQYQVFKDDNERNKTRRSSTPVL